MPLFTLPIATASSAPQSRVQFSSLPLRKRKRTVSPTPSLSSDDDARSQLSRSEAAASTNPLSLTPAEVLQYRLAGLELDKGIPTVKGWPHQGFDAESTLAFTEAHKKLDLKGKGKEIIKDDSCDSDKLEERARDQDGAVKAAEEEKNYRGPRLRLQHLSVLTTILQRCLLEGDIPRASRAWAMLIRAQVGGKGMDLRGSGYWAIGAELLMRSGEEPHTRRPERRHNADSDEDEAREDHNPEQVGERRWGSAEGSVKTKEYYERMILQHPYKRQFSGQVSALDFWPAMVGCEIYGIQFERKESLAKVTMKEENDEYENAASSDDSEQDILGAEADPYVFEERRRARKLRKVADAVWVERDEIRSNALVAYEKIAARMDELMTTPPYSDSLVLLRLRGMLALCIGDLSVPVLSTDDDLGGEDEEALERNRRLGIGGKDTDRRLLSRQRLAEHQRGKKKQKEERSRARKLFERIERDTGGREPVTDTLASDEEDAEP